MRNDNPMGRIWPGYWLAVLFIVSAGCSRTSTVSLPVDKSDPPQQDSFRFIIAADPQLFRGKIEDFDKAIESINAVEPEFVIVCGDLIENPSNQQQIQAYKEAVSKLSPPITLYNVSGNHDLGLPVKIETVLVYQANFGELWYYFTHGNSLFIVLSSDILRDSNAPMNQEHTEWLTGVLEQFQSKTISNIFVFMHHPLYLNAPDEPDAYSNMPGTIRHALLDLFVKYHVRAVFSGHHHDNKVNRYRDVDLITTNSITVPMGSEPSGFRVIEVNQDGYKNVYYTIEQLNKKESTR